VGHLFPGDRFRSHDLVECCMSGCAVCVHDLYQESLDDYNASVAAIRASLTNMKVPEDEWPETIRPGAEKASSPSLSAFQEMERALKARRGAQAQS
jgi:Oxidoreductase-like protein, N-terminal